MIRDSDRSIYRLDGEDVKKRCEMTALYMIETGATVRAAAAKFGISKSTVHKDVTERLERFSPTLFLQVREILTENKAERHLRGGEATRKKYLAQKRSAACPDGGRKGKGSGGA